MLFYLFSGISTTWHYLYLVATCISGDDDGCHTLFHGRDCELGDFR